MLREKSCGIVPFREVDGEIRYLVISSAVTKREHWEFPKGGVEKGEREVDTALRELEEETGVSDVELLPGYREPIRYIYRRPEGLVFKQVVYFIGRVGDPKVTLRLEEAKDFRWATYDEARALLRHGNAKELLFRCHAFIKGEPLPPRGPIGRKPPRKSGRGAQKQGGRQRLHADPAAKQSQPREQSPPAPSQRRPSEGPGAGASPAPGSGRRRRRRQRRRQGGKPAGSGEGSKPS